MGKMKRKPNMSRGGNQFPCLAQDNPPSPRLKILQSDVPGKSLGEQLKKVRLALGLSIPEVAKAIRVRTFAVFQMESDSVPPTPELLKKLSDLYNCRVGIFIKSIGLTIRPIVRP